MQKKLTIPDFTGLTSLLTSFGFIVSETSFLERFVVTLTILQRTSLPT